MSAPAAPPASPSADTSADAAAEALRRGRLLRVLGVGFGLAVGLGNTIGAGILRAPGEVAAQLPSAGLYMAVWVAGGVYALLGAISVAELGTMIPRSGGQYVFARRALGPYAGFVVGWSDWISTAGSCAAVAVVIGEYLGELVPALAGWSVALAIAAILACAGLQMAGVKAAGRAQEATSLLKALALLGLVAACFAWAGPRPVAAALPVPHGFPLLIAVIVALQAVIYTYDGWTGVVYFGDEVTDPGRDVPRAILGGVVAIAAIYLLINAALLHVLPLPAMAGAKLAAGEAARAVFGAGGDTIIRLLLIAALVSCLNALVLMAPRVLYAISADGLFTRRATAVSRGGTPTVALFASTVVAIVFALTGAFDRIIAVLSFFFVANYVLTFASVFVLRRREPDTPRPYRAWGYPWTTGAALVGSVAFLAGAVAGDTRNSLYTLAALAASWPIYRLSRRLAGPSAPAAE
ncbi:MAG: amino acid permease-associated region [Gemmatimonadetes bacterium]|nr:amino acid permease-associated region [Gemmatimonadota bacterium]